MTTKWLVGLLLTALAVGGVYTLTQRNSLKNTTQEQKSEDVMKNTSEIMMDKKDDAIVKFNPAKKSAHYESNTPAHKAVLAAPPINAVIDFNFDLAAPSSISITRDGKEYGIGQTVIDANKLSMRRNLDPNALDGVYKISYNACWPDRSCHEGNFEFAIDRKIKDSYQNIQDKKEVIIRMSEIMFAPKNIVINTGTKVTWVNDDTVEHFVNTDSHPAHTYYPVQNSRGLAKGASYSVTFDKPGVYPYHCSSHTTMIGSIVVI